jgi:hypothetical protein
VSARAGAIALLALSAVAGPALAEGASRVVLLRAPSDDPLAEQGNTLLAAELRAAGFEVVSRPRTPGREIRADIDAASADVSPIATFAILPAPDGAAVELWLEDRVTGKLVIRRIDVDRSREAAADLAVRAVELLRGSLLEVALPAPAPREQPPPPADVAAWLSHAVPPRRPPYFSTGVGLAAGASALASAGLGPTLAPVLRLGWGSRGGLSVGLAAAGLGPSRHLRAAEGTADVRADLALASVGLAFRPDARLQPFVGAGAGARRVSVRGQGVSSLFPDGGGAAYAFALTAGGGIAARLGDRLSLLADAELLLAWPAAEVLIAGGEAGRVGSVGLATTLLLATTF